MILWKKSEDQATRKAVARATLEQSLVDAVKATHPEFEAFVGVIVARVVPRNPGEANWTVKGVKYGKADRHRSSTVLSYCVEQAQQEFEVSN